MRRLALITAVAATVALPLPAQESDEGRLVRFIESSLSDGAARSVDLQGFRGALSSEATLDRLTVSDADGVWLTVEGAVLDWNRSAILRGRIEITALTAERVVLERLPVSEDAGPAPEATPFALPDLPVGIEVETARIDRVELGEPVLGQALALSAEASVSLSGGTGEAQLSVDRLDGPEGHIDLSASYDNATTEAAIDLSVVEDPGGIAVSLLNIEGEPSIGLTVTGAGPLDAFAADFALATDGSDRLAGSAATSVEDGSQILTFDVAGDLSPVLSGDAETFLGTDTRLSARAIRQPSGAMELQDLSLRAAAIVLDGSAALDAEGQPERFDLAGTLAPPEGDRLALPGGSAEIGGAELSLHYDRAEGEAVTGTATLDDLEASGFTAPRTELTLDGAIARDGGDISGFTGDLALTAEGLDHADEDIARALGEDLTLSTLITWQPDGPLSLADLALDAGGTRLTGDISAEPGDSRLDVEADLALSADSLAPFGGLVDREMGGAVEAQLALTAEALSGAFDADIDMTGENLVFGDPVPAALLAGTTTLTGGIARDASGMRLSGLELRGTALSLDADGSLSTENADLAVSAALTDANLADPRLAGPVEFDGTLTRDGADAPYRLPDLSLRTAYGDVDGDVSILPGEDRLDVSGDVTTRLTDIAGLSEIAGRDLGGAAALRVSGSAELRGMTFSADLSGQTRDLQLGDPVPEGLLAGVTQIDGGVDRDADGFTFRALSVDGTQLDAEVDGRFATDNADLTLAAALADLGLLDPRLDGPVRVSTSVERADAAAPYRAPDLRIASDYGTLSGDVSALPGDERFEIGADIDADISNLSVFSALAGQDLAGAATLSLEAEAEARRGTFDAGIDLVTRDVRVGSAIPAELLAGETRLTGRAGRDADGNLTFDDLTLDGQQLDATVTGRIGPEDSAASLTARLANAGIFTPALPGPVSATAEVSRAGSGPLQVDASADGPGGLTVNVTGEALQDGGSVDLAVTGSAPLALANRFIEPRSLAGTATFDLAVQGPPGIGAVSGRVATSGARLTAPTFGIALENLNASANLSGGSASIDAGATLNTGGQLAVNGTVGYGQPSLPANISIALDQARIVDPSLYEAQIQQVRLTLSGALAGSSLLSGNVLLGEVEVRVPETGLSGGGPIPDIVHVGESAAERRTRAYAGLLGGNGNGNGGGSSSIGLDVTVTAPGRVFLRGRGLDAELGGTLRVGGTTANVIPSGQFDLVRGRLSILGQRLNLVSGSATLQGSTDPYIDLTAQTNSGEYTIFVTVEGPVTSPEVGFSSNPDLPEDEVLAQLFFNRSASTLSPIQALQLADAVGSLAGGGSGVFTRVREGLGLDDLDVQSDDEGNAVVRAGRYISDNVYTDVTVDSQGTGINLNIDLTPSLTARGGVNSSGESSVGVFFERDY
ncbi:hypothetical protein HKCCE2091_16800 [Rhodobacterales bacterium HKCCE2091]|nr:hypothetical protein [Rhodobacterales bacterium HKCCE2091]